MKTHLIEWRRLVKRGQTCNRCEDTGTTLRRVVRELNAQCGKERARFRLKTVRLPATRLAESNLILVDGKPLEELVPGVKVTKTDCSSCTDLVGEATQCRAVVANGRTHEAVPSDLIRAAICRTADCCGEGCGCDCGCESAKGGAAKASCCA